ncbi:MAG: ATP-binding protein [Planctomycetaceae bacterium]|nr:ATP-binding protein [Planctomycetaceae bacterium]
MSFLFVIRGSDQGCRFEIRETVVSIGREMNNIFQLHDPEVSRKHAEIRKDNRQDIIYDLKSSNGLFVNGKRVQSTLLHSGDQIQIGRTLLLYTKTDSEEEGSSQGAVNVQIDSDAMDPAAAIIASVPKDEGTWLFESISEGLSEARQSPWLRKAKGHLKMMYHTALVVSQTLDTDRLLHRIIDLIFDWVHIDRACILLFENESKNLVPQVFRTRDTAESQSPMRISQTILDYVLNTEEGILTNDASLDDRWDPGASILADSIRDVICVPMQGRYGTIGVIYLDSFGTGESQEPDDPEKEQSRRFNRDHLKLMGAIAHQAALAVEDTRYYRGMLQAERLAAVGQTVAVLSHDIKNILQGITGGSFLIEKGLDEHNEELISQGWRIVQKNQGLISDMVLDMLALSKEREPAFSFGDINQIINDAVELMQGRVQPLEISLSWTPDDSIPAFCFDSKQMARAITNVLTNAIDAVAEQEEGKIEITSKLNEAFGRVEITIDDSGAGIPNEQKDQLFRPFQTTKKEQGTGLGLAVTQKILQEHNGNVRLTNSPLGGARFVLEIPLLISEGEAA